MVRVRPQANEYRYYRMAVWPDLFGGALLMRQWGRIGTQGTQRLIIILTREQPLKRLRHWRGTALAAGIRSGKKRRLRAMK